MKIFGKFRCSLGVSISIYISISISIYHVGMCRIVMVDLRVPLCRISVKKRH